VGSYKLLIKPSAARQIEAVPKADRLRIVRKIQALSDEPRPHGSEKLSAEEKYRLRQGPYRIIYSISEAEKTVVIVKVGHRREVYR
jgi:mRNA interferase RelE/StbE